MRSEVRVSYGSGPGGDSGTPEPGGCLPTWELEPESFSHHPAVVLLVLLKTNNCLSFSQQT